MRLLFAGEPAEKIIFSIVSVGYHTTSAYSPRTTVSNTTLFICFGFIFRCFAEIPEEP